MGQVGDVNLPTDAGALQRIKNCRIAGRRSARWQADRRAPPKWRPTCTCGWAGFCDMAGENQRSDVAKLEAMKW